MLEGDSARQIRQQLRDKAWTPISVDPVEQKISIKATDYSKKFSAYDLALMTRQLSVLVAAAIPLEEALRAVSRQSEKRMCKIFYSQFVQKYWKDIHLHKGCNSPGVFLIFILQRLRQVSVRGI